MGKEDLETEGKTLKLCGVPEITVPKKEYEKILNDLPVLSKRILNKTKLIPVGEWGKSKAIVIKTKGKKPLAVDTQGFNYPRYKSYLF